MASDEGIDRRTLLQSLGAGATVPLAGCANVGNSGSSGSDGEPPEGEEGDDNGDGSPTDGTDSEPTQVETPLEERNLSLNVSETVETCRT